MEDIDIGIVGLAAGVGGSHHGCSEGPNFIKQHMSCSKVTLNWKSMISLEKPSSDKYEQIALLNKQLADAVLRVAKEGEFFISVGGDHSSAIGTWSGVAEAKRESGDIGLIWIDASIEVPTPDHKCNEIHGVALSALLGVGDKRLTQILSNEAKLKAENVVVIGVRNCTPETKSMLKEMGVKVYFMEEVEERGLEAVMREAIDAVSRNTAGYGVSLDLHSLDPEYIQAVSSPVKGGIDPDELLSCLELFHEDPPIAFELVEYNPWFDQDKETFSYIRDLFISLSSVKRTISQSFEKVLC
jgi:arginase